MRPFNTFAVIWFAQSQCFSQQNSPSELTNVRIVFRKDGIAGKGTFGIVQRVKLLNISDIDPGANDVDKGIISYVIHN